MFLSLWCCMFRFWVLKKSIIQNGMLLIQWFLKENQIERYKVIITHDHFWESLSDGVTALLCWLCCCVAAGHLLSIPDTTSLWPWWQGPPSITGRPPSVCSTKLIPKVIGAEEPVCRARLLMLIMTRWGLATACPQFKALGLNLSHRAIFNLLFAKPPVNLN